MEVHNLLLSNFTPQRIRTDNYYALSIDPCNYSESEIDVVMRFVLEQWVVVSWDKLCCWTKESKQSKSSTLLCMWSVLTKKFIHYIKLGFSKVSYHQSAIFDLRNWIDYITKDGNLIKTLKINKMNEEEFNIDYKHYMQPYNYRTVQSGKPVSNKGMYEFWEVMVQNGKYYVSLK
jgi:hypothetical protein